MNAPPRIFLDSLIESDPTRTPLLLPEDQTHHLRDVLRLRPGAEVEVVCSKTGRLFLAQLDDDRSHILLKKEVSGSTLADRQSCVDTLIVALCKGKRNDLICEKATELGVANILFWQAERSVRRLRKGEDQQDKVGRWRRIAESASRQSRRRTVPALQLALNLDEVFNIIEKNSTRETLRYACLLTPDAQLLRKCAPPAQSVHLLIGPEGDLSDREIAEIRKNGFLPVSLGPGILRTETAAVAAVAMVDALWGFLE